METITHAAIQRSNPMIWAGIPRVKKELTAEGIMNIVCEQARITIDEIKAKTRKRNIVKPRQILCYLLRRHIKGITIVDIGSIIGGFDHTTVIHSIEVVKDLISVDEEYRDLVTKIESKI